MKFTEKTRHSHPMGHILWAEYEIWHEGKMVGILDISCLPKVPIIAIYRLTTMYAECGESDCMDDSLTDLVIKEAFCTDPELAWRVHFDKLVKGQKLQFKVDEAVAAGDWDEVSRLHREDDG